MVKSLIELCTAVCIRHIKEIKDVGDLPYGKVRSILLKVDNPGQLRQIEINSPHLDAETSECWKRLIARDFPVLSARNGFIPSNPKSWHKIYAKYQHLDREAKRVAEEKLKNAFKEIKKEKDESVSQVINYDSRKLPRLPRDVKPQVGTRPKGWRHGHDQSELRFTGGSRTKTNTPKGLLKRAFREAKEISARNRLNMPISAVHVRPGQITRAPEGMVQEKVISARPLAGIRPPTRLPESTAHKNKMEDREARLQKAKAMNSQKGGSYISDDDLDDLDIESDGGPVGLEIDDLEALSDPQESSRAKPSKPGPSAARGSVFSRKMGSSSAAPSTSTKVRTETQTSRRPPAPQKKLATTSASSPEPTSPKSALPSASPPPPGSAPALSRKRKAPVDIFMKPKPKVQRR
ncbi:hypothetical protein F5Y14DRAFT_433903 [Nemania sp. NC0429]|nr:hypothetical protein F5Y14DRAFT_433903 [Nemania sp. NC0429]